MCLAGLKALLKVMYLWFNDADQVIHSCFVLNNEFAFNKQGQTMFHPWQILRVPDIVKSWKHSGTYTIKYVKTN